MFCIRILPVLFFRLHHDEVPLVIHPLVKAVVLLLEDAPETTQP